MKKCMLGCGLVVHDVDQHIDSFHQSKRSEEEFPDPLRFSDVSWDQFYNNEAVRDRFVSENFQDVTL